MGVAVGVALGWGVGLGVEVGVAVAVGTGVGESVAVAGQRANPGQGAEDRLQPVSRLSAIHARKSDKKVLDISYFHPTL